MTEKEENPRHEDARAALKRLCSEVGVPREELARLDADSDESRRLNLRAAELLDLVYRTFPWSPTPPREGPTHLARCTSSFPRTAEVGAVLGQNHGDAMARMDAIVSDASRSRTAEKEEPTA